MITGSFYTKTLRFAIGLTLQQSFSRDKMLEKRKELLWHLMES